MHERSTQHLYFLRLELGRLQQLPDDDLQAQRYAALGVAWAVHQALEWIAWEVSGEEASRLRARAAAQCPALVRMEQLASAGKQYLSGAAEPAPRTVAQWGQEVLDWLAQWRAAPAAPPQAESVARLPARALRGPALEAGVAPA